MSEKKTVVIIEKSFVIRKGLLVLLNQISHIGKIIELDEEALYYNRIAVYSPDIVIVNPILVGYLQKKTVREVLGVPKSTKIVSLVYSYFEEQILSLYDAVIRIEDSKEKIEEIFYKLQKFDVGAVEEENRDLTEREKEILIGVVKGFMNKEIADNLNISINTVITHRRNIARKLDVHSSAGLTVYAILNKLVNIDDLKN
jgi:DNA-binding NarL/FixJ family response regulator